MTDNQLFLITGVFVLICAFFVILLDRRSKNKGPIQLREMPLWARILCLFFGILIGGIAILDGGVIQLLILAGFLIFCALLPGKKQPSELQIPGFLPYESTDTIPNKEPETNWFMQVKILFLKNVIFRWLIILTALAFFLGGIFWLFIHPPLMEKYGWIIILFAFLVYEGSSVIHFIRWVKKSNKD